MGHSIDAFGHSAGWLWPLHSSDNIRFVLSHPWCGFRFLGPLLISPPLTQESDLLASSPQTCAQKQACISFDVICSWLVLVCHQEKQPLLGSLNTQELGVTQPDTDIKSS